MTTRNQVRAGANRLTSALLKKGLGPPGSMLLTVAGRKSGKSRTSPVTVLEKDDERVIQSVYGQTDWVRNLRAAETATLTRGAKVEEFRPVELTPEEAAPILKAVVPGTPRMIRKYFDVADDAPLDDWERIAADHPMFRIVGEKGYY